MHNRRLYARLIANGRLNMQTGHGTGLVLWYDLVRMGKFKYAWRRIVRAVVRPTLAHEMAAQTAKYRARVRRWV